MICTLYDVSHVSFEWDERKAAANQRKHGVSFDEAESVFADEYGLLLDDPQPASREEDRFLLLGLSSGLRTLVVCHGYQESRDTIRLISARKATRPERQIYNARWK